MQRAGVRMGTSGIVLLTLASGQFLMTLDSSVMNVSIATVAADVGTTVTGIQTAITLYTLVMASFMITGGKIGQIVGRKRAFAIGCVVYGCGSFVTSIAPNLTVLIVGWSVLEGVGAALIMPAIVALVASNFGRAERPRAYGLVASAGAIAVAAGPLIGGLFTTYLSWRYVFVGEVLVVGAILALTRRIADVPPEKRVKLDLVGTALSALGLALVVFGILRSGTWGLVRAKPAAPEWLGLSPVIWLMLAGRRRALALRGVGESPPRPRRTSRLVDPAMLRNRVLRGGLISFFFQYLLQAGLFFVVPLFLSVALGLSAIATGVRLLPLSITLLLAAAGIPKLFPNASPRRVVRVGFLALFAGIVVMVAALDAGAGPEIVTWPMLLAGLGIGALASQLGSVTVSSVPDEQSRRGRRPAEHGDEPRRVDRHRARRRGAHLSADDVVPDRHRAEPRRPLRSRHPRPPSSSPPAFPFVSDQQLQTALDEAGVSADDGRRDRRRERRRAPRRTAYLARGPCDHRADRPVLHPQDPDRAASIERRELIGFRSCWSGVELESQPSALRLGMKQYRRRGWRSTRVVFQIVNRRPVPASLTGHGDAEAFLGVDEVVVVVLADADLDPADLAGEPTALCGVVGSDAGAGLVAMSVGSSAEKIRLGHLDAAGADLVAVVEEGHVAALGEAASGVGKFHADLVHAGRDRESASVANSWIPRT